MKRTLLFFLLTVTAHPANGRVMTLCSGFTGHQRWLFDAGLAANPTSSIGAARA